MVKKSGHNFFEYDGSSFMTSNFISPDAVEKLLKLSGLDPQSEDVQSLQQELESILGYIQQLQSLQVGDVVATSHALQGEAVNLREDIQGEHLDTQIFLSSCPDTSGRFIRVPLIIEG